MCKRRKSGKVPGGEEALESYKDTGNRKQLAKILVEAKFNEARSACELVHTYDLELVCSVHLRVCVLYLEPCQKLFAVKTKKFVTKEKEKSLTVDAGWYTEQEMKEKLNYDAWLGLSIVYRLIIVEF